MSGRYDDPEEEARRHAEYERIGREQTDLERKARKHLMQAIEFARARWNDGYEYEYLMLLIENEQAKARANIPPSVRGYTKRKISGDLRRQVFERDQYRCVYCGDYHNLAADHIIPESKGGPTTFENLQTLCQTCNLRKGHRQ